MLLVDTHVATSRRANRVFFVKLSLLLTGFFLNTILALRADHFRRCYTLHRGINLLSHGGSFPFTLLSFSPFLVPKRHPHPDPNSARENHKRQDAGASTVTGSQGSNSLNGFEFIPALGSPFEVPPVVFVAGGATSSRLCTAANTFIASPAPEVLSTAGSTNTPLFQ